MGRAKEHGMAVDEVLSGIAHQSGALDTCEHCEDVIWGDEEAEAAGQLAREKYARGEHHDLFSSADDIAGAAEDFVNNNGNDECHCKYVAGKDD